MKLPAPVPELGLEVHPAGVVDEDADEAGSGLFREHDLHVRATVVEHLFDLILKRVIDPHICTLNPDRGRKKRRVGAHLDDCSRPLETTFSVAPGFSR